MPKTRNNHYVPEWYQSGFVADDSKFLHFLDIAPTTKRLNDGRKITITLHKRWPVSKCFRQRDLYTTFFGGEINDDIEKFLFGEIDNIGAKAVRAFIGEDMRAWHDHFSNFFSYIDSQKIRTPKGLDWLRKYYPKMDQHQLMMEMQAIRNLHCTIWTEGVREIVSAKQSDIKFIVSDHPVTIYNYSYPPKSPECTYPNEPSVTNKGTQTIFPLNKDYCLILTNLEYAREPHTANATEERTNPRLVRQSMVRTDAFIRVRALDDKEVATINLIQKRRAKRYIAAAKEEWLFPENGIEGDWKDLGGVLLPQKEELHRFGGEIYAGYQDGSTYYQDEFGRTSPQSEFLKKTREDRRIGRNDACGCGSGKKFKKCCLNKREEDRTTWNVLSIRERNLVLVNGISRILGLDEGKEWNEVRRDLSEEQVAEIHKLYGALWPTDTQIFDLLPKPDGTLRALYTGVIDPRMIGVVALGATPYFDEVLIEHPFVNPHMMKPEYNPVESPKQYKQRTLRDTFLLLCLEPFIDAGVVNFFPDPCCFDRHLHRQMLKMAEQRTNGIRMSGRETERFQRLCEEEFLRSIRTLPRDQKIAELQKAIPDISPQGIDEAIRVMEEQHHEDPFALLQEDVYRDGGQMLMMSLAPNFEMALFIAQATGSIVLTDSDVRWIEMENAQHKDSGRVDYPWAELSDVFGETGVLFTTNLVESLSHRLKGTFARVRKVLRECYLVVSKDQRLEDANVVNRIKAEFRNGLSEGTRAVAASDSTVFEIRMKYLMPKGGFVDTNVQRLLLKSGSNRHLPNTPMAIFVEYSKDGD